VKVPIISARECVAALQRAGFTEIRKRGSHINMRRSNPYGKVVVPDHNPIKPGTLRNIIKQAGLTVEEFVELLK
jgi:predicted RNA binding protein YcfA (HicA-like mRNA interferase family)